MSGRKGSYAPEIHEVLTRFAAGSQDNAGLAKSTGLFSAPPPLCITEPYKGPDRIAARFKGKQIVTGYLKHDKSNFAPGTFNPPQLLWSESKDQFKDGFDSHLPCYRLPQMCSWNRQWVEPRPPRAASSGQQANNLTMVVCGSTRYKDIFPGDKKKNGLSPHLAAQLE